MTRLFGTLPLSQAFGNATLRGAASAFNLSGNASPAYQFFATPAEADRSAMIDDIRNVIEDAVLARGVVDGETAA